MNSPFPSIIRCCRNSRTENKVVYHLTASSLDACYGADLKISFRAENSELGFTVPVDGSTASRRYTVNDTWDGNYTLETVQISPLGVLLIGREAQAWRTADTCCVR